MIKDVMKKITPFLREYGFKGSGQRFYKEDVDIVITLEFGSNGIAGYFTAVVYVYLYALMDNIEKKRNENFRKGSSERFSPGIFTENGDIVWPLDSSEENIEEFKRQFNKNYSEFVISMTNIKQTIRDTPAAELLPLKEEDSNIYGNIHPIVCRRFANIAKAFGFIDRSIEYAELGLTVIEERPAVEPSLRELINQNKANLN